MMRLVWRSLLVTMTMCLLVGCGKETGKQNLPEGQEDAYVHFVDDLGVEITLSEKPKKVAVLFSSFAEVWQTAGGMVEITVGESVERGFAPDTAVLVDAGAGKTINQELLIEAEPDLVICSADIEAQVKTAELLHDAGIPAACFRVEVFEDYLRMLKVCTDITGDADAYQEHGMAVQERIRVLLDEITVAEDGDIADESEGTRQKILFIRAGSGASATKAKTAEQHFAAAMLKEIGTDNIAEEAPMLLDGLSIEAILQADPDYIFISTMGDAEAAVAHMDSVLQEPTWQSLTAVQEGNYAYLPKELFQFKPNGRWDEAYEYLIDLVYTE